MKMTPKMTNRIFKPLRINQLSITKQKEKKLGIIRVVSEHRVLTRYMIQKLRYIDDFFHAFDHDSAEEKCE